MNRLDTILLISNSTGNRTQLRTVLESSYNLLEATNASQAELLFQQNTGCIVSIVTDMSDCDTIDPIISSLSNEVPLILVCEDDSPRILHMGFGYGASDVIPLHYDPDAMLHRIDTITQLHNHKRYLQRMVDEQAEILRSSNDAMVNVLSSIIEYRSVESGQHILRIRHFTKLLLEELKQACPEYGLTEEIISIISSASALHDIGKIAIPDSILMKPGKLTEEERRIMQTHATTGCRILESLQDMANREYLRYAHNICHYHHERWDGSGYPDGLSGDAIPICAQVVGLADAYDALTNKRVYKDAYDYTTAVNMILNGECGIFSPKLLECFKHILPQFAALAQAYADGLPPQTEVFDVSLPLPAFGTNADTLERAQSKFNCLLHYMNCFVLELSVDLGHHHLRYNPYPELSLLTQANSFAQLEDLIMTQLVHPEDAERMQQLIHRDISQFLKDGLRRQTFHFRFLGKEDTYDSYDLTLLRANVYQTTNRSMAILCRKQKEHPLTTQSTYLDAGLYTMAESVYFCKNDRYFTLIRAGRDTHTVAGYTPREIRQLFAGHLIELIHPDDRAYVQRCLQQELNHGSEVQVDYRILQKDGSFKWFSNKSRMVLAEDGQEYIYSFLTDISAYKQAQEDLQNKLDRYEIILAQTENVLFDWEPETDTISFSETWEKLFGFDPITRNVRAVLTEGTFLHPDDVSLLLDAISRLNNGADYEMAEVRIATARGRYLWCRFRASAVRDSNGKLLRICGIIINIEAEKLAEQDLKDKAERDSLTKLLNKQAARKQAEEYFAQYPNGPSCALMIIDLDNFKQVNDQYGHLFGDAVLTQAAREIRKIFRAQDIIGRIGGDEFMVLMRGVSDQYLLQSRCQHLVRSFQQFFRNQHQNLPLSCSIGVAVSPDHGSSYVELFQHADLALYNAKAKGKNCFMFYSPQITGISAQKRTAVSNHIDSDEEPGLADSSLVQYAFQRLYSSRDVAASVNEILSIVGKKMNVSRVYVFENSDDNRFCSNTYEWCNEGITPEIHNLQNISYETDIPNYEDNFNEQGIFYCPDINDLPKKTYDIVAPQGIKSMLHCAIRENGIFRGYIGFDECVNKRFWTKEQIRMLSYFSDMLSVFLLKKREQERAIQHSIELKSILDNQNALIYIIDPDTCQLKYLNAKTRSIAPDAQPGMYCYQALMGNSCRCEGCPSARIRETTTASKLLYNKVFKMHIWAEATLIQWNETQSCLLTCREYDPTKVLPVTEAETSVL